MRRAPVVAITGAVALWAAPAAAVERESHIGGDFGPTMLTISGKSSPDIGATVGLHYTYGISDAFNLVADAAWSLVALNETLIDPTTPRNRPTNVTNVDAGVAYVLDVLTWVPWGAAEIGGYALQGGTIGGVQVLPGVALSVGLDYRFTRSFSAGLMLREHLLFTQMSTYTSFTQALLRAEYVWGW
jgi:hypothetical protein